MNKKSKENIFSPKLKREIVFAERFVLRVKAKKEIPLRTLIMMGNRMRALHKKIKPINELRELEKDIDAALFAIARSKVRHDRMFVKKKKVRTFGDTAMNKKKKSYRQ